MIFKPFKNKPHPHGYGLSITIYQLPHGLDCLGLDHQTHSTLPVSVAIFNSPIALVI